MSLASPIPVLGYDRHRSSTSTSSTPRKSQFPGVEHPSKRLDDEQRNSLDIRGRSREGFGEGKLLRHEYSLPSTSRRRGRKHRSSSSTRSTERLSKSFQQLEEIPEDADVIYRQDREKVRLPIFGRRAESSDASSYGRETPRTSRVIIDELETLLREKVRSQLQDIRRKFRQAADGQSNGKITPAALQHFLATIFGTQRQIPPSQIDQLIQRLHLKHRKKITFEDFLQALFNEEEQMPEWVSAEQTSRVESSAKKTATQIFQILKEKVKHRNRDLVTLVPALNGGASSRIFKAQFHNALIDMGYRMKDTEFDKLWEKFDMDGFKAVPSEKFLKILTNESIGEETSLLSERDEHEEDNEDHPQTTRAQTSRDPLDENQIQKWLNHKFPRGFAELEKSLERLDFKQMGTLPRDRFLRELKRFGLKLEPHLLEFFLKRLNVDLSLTSDGIPYRDVINAFKQKSDPTRKRINADNPLPAEETRQTALERQIDYAISMNYDRVREQLHRLDPSRHGTVSANEIRSIVEDLIHYTLKPDEYYQFLKEIPMDEHGRIKYKDFLKQVLDRTLQFQEQLPKTSRSPQYEFSAPMNTQKKINPQQLKEKDLQERSNGDMNTDQPKTRSIEELREMLKGLVRNRSKDIEDQFKQLDRGSYGELTPDLLYQLFKRLSLAPAVSRTEVDLIWSLCHLKRDGNLDFVQFLREFGYSKRSAHYPNAKHNPPKRGDADFILTSNRLYGDSVLVRGTVLSVIKSKWNELRREFSELDPYRTSFVQSDEFDDILTELCPSVNQDDLDALKYRFKTNHDSRINYVRFLKHYAPAPELIGAVDDSNKNALPTIQEKSPRSTSDRSMLTLVSNKLRRKLSDSHKQLRRTFKQHDTTNTGAVPVKIFKDILNQYKCSLNDEEFYSLISQIDTQMDGTINYNYFLQQYIKHT